MKQDGERSVPDLVQSGWKLSVSSSLLLNGSNLLTNHFLSRLIVSGSESPLLGGRKTTMCTDVQARAAIQQDNNDNFFHKQVLQSSSNIARKEDIWAEKGFSAFQDGFDVRIVNYETVMYRRFCTSQESYKWIRVCKTLACPGGWNDLVNALNSLHIAFHCLFGFSDWADSFIVWSHYS